jgi:uncharacterized caspase-like protein
VLTDTFARTGKGVFRQITVDPLLNKEASRENIMERLGKLHKQVGEGDVAVITLAGHGDRDTTGKFYFVPANGNAEPDKLLGTCVDGDQVKNVLASLPCRVILVLDACHAAAVGAVAAAPRVIATARVADNLVRDLVSEDRGVIVMCSAMGKEVAMENAKVGHGFFTKALEEGLMGQAKSADGLVYLRQLDAFVYDRVKELSRDRQHPVITRPPSIRSFPLARP